MKRTLAVLLLAVGTVLFGVAKGLVYLDHRAVLLRDLQLKEAAITGKPPPASRLHDSELDMVTPYNLVAMGVGPLGAGLGLAGRAILVLELPWFARGGGRSAHG